MESKEGSDSHKAVLSCPPVGRNFLDVGFSSCGGGKRKQRVTFCFGLPERGDPGPLSLFHPEDLVDTGHQECACVPTLHRQCV